MEFELDGSLKEWVKDKPLSILQLDPADRAVLRIADERDAIQKKTFTKWVNKHLKKTYTCLHVCVLVNNQPCCSPTASRHVGDLFEDLRDGHNLISLLEVLSGEHLPRERGRMRFHMLQNVQMALDFLRYKKIKLVNIRAEDIVDGNPKLTLGLIWTIILHFQSWRRKISDIVVGQEANVTAREALLRWARRSTARYPGVRVTDFTASWRDGLAFSALIHRNRPDLVDWRGARASQPRERLDRVFHVAEREYGVTRLLDPEDVDTPEPDEKSLITYISSLYDVFPEPPAIHPLYDAEAQKRSAEYRELASSLHLWIREKMSLMQERAFPPTLIEMKKLAADSTKFKNDEMPPRYRDKQRLSYIFRDLQKYFEAVGEVDFEPELHIEVIEKNWARLMMLHQEREQAIVDEIKRLERLQRLAERVHRETKATDNRLEELEKRVKQEASRLDRLYPLEAKHAVGILEQEIRKTEIQSIFTDVHTLTEGRYSQAAELHKRVQKLHQRWVALRSLLHKLLVQPLSEVSFPVEERVVTKYRTTVHETRLVDTNPHFRALHDCIDWCKAKLKQLQEADYGSDLPSVQNELELHQREHKDVEQFHPKVERCLQAKSHFHGEELTLYGQHLTGLQKLYAELLATSGKRLSDLDTLHDFIQSATGELVWLNSKEETEVTRDWSDKNLNLQSIEQYYESLMSDLEKREIQFSAVQDRGEALVLQHHPAAKTIEAYMSAMQSQWAWLLQLTLCLEVHLKHASQSQQFFREVQQSEQWISKRDETLNSIYSKSEFSLDEGERLLKGMQELREELNGYGERVQKLVEQAKEIVPMKQRRQPVTRPLQVTCICTYKQVNTCIEKGEQCTLYDNSGRVKWRVKNEEGVESPVPGVCFVLQPPDKEAIEIAERLRRQYDRSVALWQRKQLRLRQNMIFATIKVVKGWDLPQFLAMGQDQRTAIRKALNEDAEKLLSEGDPADPQLRRLKREMAEVNKLFDELEKRARAEEESKNAGRIFNEQISSLQEALEEAERVLDFRIAGPLPRDLDGLEHSVLQHKDYEQSLRRLAPDLERAQQTFRGITLKTPAMRNKLDAVNGKWNHLWNLSNLYIERLKCVEIVLSSLEENTSAISEFEMKLASFGELPAESNALRDVLEELMLLQNAIGQQQHSMDRLNEDAHNARRLVEKSRPNHRGPHADMDRLDAEVNRLNARWTNVCGQLVDRLRTAETAYGLAQQLEHAYRKELEFVDESYGNLQLENAKDLLRKVVDRAPAVEATNVVAGRLIREGKIYGQRLRAFKEQLEDVCPSMDASMKKPRMESMATVDDVARDLDTLNGRYSALVALLQSRAEEREQVERVEQAAVHRSDDSSVQRILQEQRPLRTFRTEYNIYESSSCEERYTTRTTHYTQYSSERTERLERSEKNERTETSETTVVSSDAAARERSIEERRSLDETPVIVGDSRVETVSAEGPDDSPPREDSRTGSRQVEREEATYQRESLEARTRVVGAVDEAEKAAKVRRVRLTGDATTMEATRAATGRPSPEPPASSPSPSPSPSPAPASPSPPALPSLPALSALSALPASLSVEEGSLDPRTGELVTSHGERLTAEEACARGYLAKLDVAVSVKTSRPASFSEAISRGLLEETGTSDGFRFANRITGDTHDLIGAIDGGMLEARGPREIVDPSNDTKLTLQEAMRVGLIDPRTGEYVLRRQKEKKEDEDEEKEQRFSPREARQRGLIAEPVTLRECLESGLLAEDGSIASPIRRERLTIVEAIERGVLDGDRLRSVVDPKSGEVVTLETALERGLVVPSENGPSYRNPADERKLSLAEAARRGLLISHSRKSIFDIEGFADPATGEYVGLRRALRTGILVPRGGGRYVVDPNTDRSVSPKEAVEHGWIRAEVLEQLDRAIGIYDGERELGLLEAVFAGRLDPESCLPVDPLTGRPLPLETAIGRGLLTTDGGALLAGLWNVSVESRWNLEADRTPKSREAVPSGRDSARAVGTTTIVVARDVTVSRSDASFRVAALLPADKERQKDKDEEETVVEEEEEEEAATAAAAAAATVRRVFELPADGWTLAEAIDRRLFDPVTGLFIIPGTDRLVSFEECVKLGIIDANSSFVVDPNNGRKVSLLRSLEKNILDSTGHYGTSGKITMKEAIENGSMILEDGRSAEESDSRHGRGVLEITRVSGVTGEERLEFTRLEIATDVEDVGSVSREADANDSSAVVAEGTSGTGGSPDRADREKPAVGASAAGMEVDSHPDRESTRAGLRKMRKRAIKSTEALESGLMDAETAEMLTSRRSLENGGAVTLSEAIRGRRIEASAGRIVDPQRGDVVSIGEALERGIVDPQTAEVLVPLAKSLSIPGLYRQGLLDPREGKVVHPETGAHLTLGEAILCEIVDPLSVLTCPNGRTETLRNAIANDLVDAERSLVRTADGVAVNLLEAVESNVFADSAPSASSTSSGGPRANGPPGTALGTSTAATNGVVSLSTTPMKARTARITCTTERAAPREIPPAGMTFPVALERGLIEANGTQIRHPITEERLPLKDAIRGDFIMSLPYPPASDGIEVTRALEAGLVDRERGVFVHPSTGTPVPIHEAIESGLLLMKSSPEAESPIDDFAARGCPVLGAPGEPRSPQDGRMSDDRAADSTESTEKMGRTEPRRPGAETTPDATVELHERVGDAMSKTREGVSPSEAARVALSAVVVAPVLAGKALYDVVRDAVVEVGDGERLERSVVQRETRDGAPLKEGQRAAEAPIRRAEKPIDPTTDATSSSRGFESKTDEAATCTEAARMAATAIETERNIETKTETESEAEAQAASGAPSLIDAIVRRLYSPTSGLIADPETGERRSAKRALLEGRLEGASCVLRDERTERVISLKDAEESRLIDLERGLVTYPQTMTLDVAHEKGYLLSTTKPWSLQEALAHDTYDPDTGRFRVDGRSYTLEEAVDRGIVDGNGTSVRDPRTGEILALTEGIERGLIEPKSGTAIDPTVESTTAAFSSPIPLSEALERGLIVPAKRKISLPEAILKGLYEPETGRFIVPQTRERLSTERAIEVGAIDPGTAVILPRPNGGAITFDQAIEERIVDPSRGTLRLPSTAELPREEKSRSKAKGKKSEGVREGEEGEAGEAVTATEGSMDFREALERGLLLEARRPMTFAEVLFKGILDERTNAFLDPQTGRRLTLLEAVRSNLIDAEAVRVSHGPTAVSSSIGARTAREELREPWESAGESPRRADRPDGEAPGITLAEAVEIGRVDGSSGRVNLPDHEMSLREAYDSGVIVDDRAPVSLQRAIERGLYDERTGKIGDPLTGRALTVHEAMRRCVLGPTLPCYWDRRAGRLLSLAETCRAGIIDRRFGTFREPGSERPVSLRLALRLGLILDIENHGAASGDLYRLISTGLYDPHSATFERPEVPGERLTLGEARSAGLVDSRLSIVRDPLSDRYVPLEEAVANGIIDDARGTHIASERGPGAELREAAATGLLVPGIAPLDLWEAVRCGLYRPDGGANDAANDVAKDVENDVGAIDGNEVRGGTFVDPRSNDRLTPIEAFEHGLVDAEATAIRDAITGRIVALREAIEDPATAAVFLDAERDWLVDARTGLPYDLEEPVRREILRSILLGWRSPRAVRSRPTVRFAGETEQGLRRTLAEAIEEGSIEPSTAVVRDPGTGRFVELTEALAEGLVDLGAIEEGDPAGRSSVSRVLRFGDARVYLERPISLEEAIERSLLCPESGKLTDPRTGRPVALKDAVAIGLVDPDSALLKDTEKKRLVRLPEAFRRGLMDAEKGSVLDTETSRLYALSRALEANLLVTPKRGVPFVEALRFGLYDPVTGGFVDPFRLPSGSASETNASASDERGQRDERGYLTLREAIDSGSVDPSGALVREPTTGKVISFIEALSTRTIDPIAGRFVQDPPENTLDFAKALERGYILTAEARQAVEEKYRLCDENSTKLLRWIAEVEERLANRENVNEDLDKLRKQISETKEIRDDLESHARPVASCLDQIRQVVLTGGDVLSSEEVSTLEKNGRSLKTRFDAASDRSEKLLRRLTAARDELAKFENESSTFSRWLEEARQALEEKELALSDLSRLNSSTEATRDFISDVIAHQADLRFITMAAQKFVDESKEFLRLLNEFRTSLPQRLPHKEPTSGQDSAVRGQVSNATSRYKDLLSRANLLSDRLSGLAGRQREYRESLEKARVWLRELEPKVRRVLSESIAAEPKQVEDQLGRAKGLNNDLLANERLIENVGASVVALLRALDGRISPAEVADLEEPAKSLEEEYRRLSDALAERCQELDAALVRSQGVQDALDGLLAWLNAAEAQYKNIQRPASLQRERLEEQQKEQRLLQADLDSHRLSVEAVAGSARELLSSSSDARLAKRTESKLKDVQTRFEKLTDKSLRWGEFLEEVGQALGEFLLQVGKFDAWYARMIEALETRDSRKLEVAEYESKMAALMDEREDRRAGFEDLVRNGRNLVSKKDVTDVSPIRDKINSVESRWKEINGLIDEKQRLGKSRAEQLSAYEELRDRVVDWLTRTENRLRDLEPVAVDADRLKRQAEELKPIQKEYRDYGNTIDKVNDLGIAYDSLLRERTESPTRRRISASPTKRTVRRMSQDGRSPSPAKSYAVQSPVSPGGSSGFSSRRSSQEGFHLEDLSPVQQQLSEINNRYGLLGVRLTDRQTEIDGIREELRRHTDNLKALSQFLDKIHRHVPKESVPSTKEEADKTAKQIKSIVEEMYEKQSTLDSTRSQVRDLVRRKQGADGIARLNDETEQVSARWRSFAEHCKERIAFLDNVKEFCDTSETLLSWLGAKEKMLGALGPISADPRMVASQVQQVQVLREEFRTQQPQLDHLTQVGERITSVIPIESADGQRIAGKLRAVLDKWSDQLARLEERARSLGDAVDTSREFDASLNRLRDALQAISDNLDDLSLEKDPEDQLRKIENLERQLEGQRPLLADAEASGEQLCEVLSDPASRSEIHGKLAAVGKLYNNLQKKLDHKKAEIEGNLRDGRQFEASCTKTLGWLADELGNMSEKLLVSADRDVLQQQLDHHEPVYRSVMGKEHEVIMLLNKGRDAVARSQRTENRSLQRDLDKMQSQWDRLKKDTLERHTKLQTCAEHCRKYYGARDAFLPWLRQAEDRLDCLKPASLKRKDIEKQLKEISSFRNEVWKHSGEFENVKTLGETFLAACDIDKQNVKNELATAKTRWEKLNNDLLARTQSLEDTARHLMDLNENLRDLRHGLQRCEDKLGSHDALGGAAKDPKLLDRIKSLREETAALKKPLQCAKQQANDLTNKAGEQGVDASHLQDEVDNVADRINDLQAKLDDRCNELQSAATAVAQFNDQARSISQQVSALEKEIDSMRAPARETKAVRLQAEETSRLAGRVNRLYELAADLENRGERLVDHGFAADAVATREQVDSLKRQIGKLDDRCRDRQEELAQTLEKLQDFARVHGSVTLEIEEASERVKRFKPVGSEVESIKGQQEDFRSLKTEKIEPLGRAVEECNQLGQSLIQTAGRDVSTAGIEKDLDRMNERWNDLKERLNERDRRLDVGLLQSGKFQEALDGLEKWLTDTEEMVSNQKPPSSDYKVVKAQLQEQKFLRKMLLDRQNSMSSLYNMGQEVAAGAEAKERKSIEKRLKELVGRFDRLTDCAADRMDALEQAMAVARQFQERLLPLTVWLERTEKRVREMELVPTDEEKIQQRVAEHDRLHEDVLSRRCEFAELTETAGRLMALVGEEEASALADKLQEAADRYAALVERSEALGGLLQRSRQGLRRLVLTYQDLQAWMESMEARLSKYRVLAVHTEKLLQQMEDLADLTEEVSTRQTEVDATTDTGLELMRHISSDEALQLKDKLDSLQRRFNDLVGRGSDLLKHAQESLPLVQQFHDNHNRLMDWMQAAESALQSAEPREEEIARLEMEISEYRPVLDKINAVGPQLSQASPGEGAATIEGLVTRDNRRFDAIAEQIQRKAERIQLSKQRSLEVIGDIDDLAEWFREVDNQLREAEPPSSEPEIIRVQLKEHKALNDDISSQKGRVRDVISTAKKVIRENGQHEDASTIREKMEELRETMETVSGLSADRLGALEQALPLAEHLRDTHVGLIGWLEEAEQQVAMLPMPALRPDLIAAQQDKNELLAQSINEHKPLLEKLDKTGEALIRLCNEEEGLKIQEIIDADTARYAALRSELRARQQALEQALQESSQFSDKLEGMLRALTSTAEQVNGAEPVSAHPGRLRDQMEENAGLMDELAHRSEAYAAVKRAADDVISKAGNRADPAVKDIKRKLEKLNKLWADVQRSTSDRGQTLDDALTIAEKFWSELNGVMSTLRELQDALAGQAPPAAQPAAIQQQQVALQEIRQEIDQTKPDVEQVRASGHELMGLCGEPDKPEVRKHIEDLDQAWDNVTALYARREENLIDAMEKAMEFHETLQNLLDFLLEAEEEFARMGPLGSDIDEVKRQIKQLAAFKARVDPHMVKVEALNRQAAELTERTSSEQAAAIKEPLGAVNKRWDGLLRGLVERQRLLENALLRLGQFQHALDELLVWIEKTDDTLDGLRAVAGDPQVIEVELAKLKVLVNDIQAHQTSVDTLNDAGRQLIEDGKGTAEASTTAEKLGTLNRRWRDLLQRAADRQRELEDALREAQSFTAEIQDLLSWLGDVDNAIVASKPVGGLPETASEQLERFMEVYNELEETRPKVETVLQQGQEYLKRADSASVGGLNHNLRSLKQRWDNVTARASDKKIKLEIALKEATEFHDALQVFVDWLTNAEKILTNLKPVSRVMETILGQIEEHKAFQKDVGVHRETMLNLDKKGTHLKYFSQKQDVILIKNLLISVQHRWERVVSKSAERTRALDHGYKEAREFHDAWSSLMNWLEETERALDEAASDGSGIGSGRGSSPLAVAGNEPDKIKSRLNRHRELQKALGAKQASYDATMKTGKVLKDKAPKTDEYALKELLNELKNKWTTVCGKCVERQRRLEEALLFSGQFKEAIQVLLDWLSKSEKRLADTGPLCGDLDTVVNLVERHKTFERDLESRGSQMESVMETGRELLEKAATPEDATSIREQLSELNDLWETVGRLSGDKSLRLEEALREAERLHKAVHVLLEWLGDAEMKLRFAGQLPEDEQESRNQLIEHENFLRDLRAKEVEKDRTLELANVILAKAHPDGVPVVKHWITIVQSRWEEVATWAYQRNQRLENHMRGLQDLDNLLEELLSWLEGLENTLNALEAEPLPDDRLTLEALIADHREFMENASRRQNEVDRVCKARQVKAPKDARKIPKAKSPAPIRASPGRERTPDLSLPHIGPRFPPKGSKGADPEFRSPRVKLLWDRWRNVWMLAWERQRRLQDKYNYIQELDRVANFSWEDWRKRFLKFMNHKKSRLTDLFRKMDKNNDGLIPREDFIQGIMNTKFETSRLEMGAVADLFDRHGEGLIDWKEFIAALRPDWEERRTYNDTDKIHDEVKRLVMLCTCRQKFRVFQVGEGKYRFGDSQKLRLVRILRSTVMVRVGGGWVALDEFLLKNDPCRAKGRTNIELREQFILADGVSQTMTAFRSKPSPTSTLQRTQIASANAGPITKVRERSARSVPMGQSRASRSSLSAGTPDSLSDNETSFKIGPSPSARKTGSTVYRSSLTPGGSRPSSRPASRPASRPTSRPGSRPASRQGSKPPSRYGSTQSLDSTDDSNAPSRIPRRTSTGTTGNTPTSSRHNSMSGKRLGTPVNGSSSRPRTPTGLVSPAGGISSRTRTPSSGSSTPLPPSLKLSRKPSGASDTSVSTSPAGTTSRKTSSGRPTPIDQRAPFRL